MIAEEAHLVIAEEAHSVIAEEELLATAEPNTPLALINNALATYTRAVTVLGKK